MNNFPNLDQKIRISDQFKNTRNPLQLGKPRVCSMLSNWIISYSINGNLVFLQLCAHYIHHGLKKFTNWCAVCRLEETGRIRVNTDSTPNMAIPVTPWGSTGNVQNYSLQTGRKSDSKSNQILLVAIKSHEEAKTAVKYINFRPECCPVQWIPFSDTLVTRGRHFSNYFQIISEVISPRRFK